MKHATSRMMFAYWDALRGERAAPERADVQPGAMRHVLADAFVLAREPVGATSFRLAGTRVSAFFGRELAGVPFRDLWAAAEQDDADEAVAVVAGDTVGVLLGLVGANENGTEVALEMLLLPLRHRGRPDARLIGVLSPGTVPSWAGLVPLRSLATRSLRIIEPGRPDRGALPRATPVPDRRGLFVVHEGGLA